MANPEHLEILKQGAKAWKEWRKKFQPSRSSLGWGSGWGVAQLGDESFVIVDLSGADLSGADLSGVDLSGADLSGADLSRVVFKDASFREANLSGANLRGADLRSAWLWNANMRGAQLGGAQLEDAYLEGANLENADLSDTNLYLAHLKHAKLTGANLRRAYLIYATLEDADLSNADFVDANISRTHCERVNLSDANLSSANFSDAKLSGANLSGAELSRTNLSRADLRNANLSNATLTDANFQEALLAGANLDNAKFCAAVLTNVDLSQSKGLHSVRHVGPSSIGIDTLYKSKGQIPEVFLRGCGVPDSFIAQAKALIGAEEGIQFYSCFISYSGEDDEFARRLHGRLQQEHVRVWFAPHDMQGGKKLHEQIDEAIRIYDKLLLILSPSSILSDWVMTELRNALRAERKSKCKLFPIGLVDYTTLEEWKCYDGGQDLAAEVRQYFIPDFTNWKDHDAFEVAFARLLKDLRADEKAILKP